MAVQTGPVHRGDDIGKGLPGSGILALSGLGLLAVATHVIVTIVAMLSGWRP